MRRSWPHLCTAPGSACGSVAQPGPRASLAGAPLGASQLDIGCFQHASLSCAAPQGVPLADCDAFNPQFDLFAEFGSGADKFDDPTATLVFQVGGEGWLWLCESSWGSLLGARRPC